MTTLTATPEMMQLVSPLDDFFGFLRLFFSPELPSAEPRVTAMPSDVELALAPLRALVAPLATAPNLVAVREDLGRIAISVEFAELERALLGTSLHAQVLAAGDEDFAKPSRTAIHRVGRVAAELLGVTMRRWLAAYREAFASADLDASLAVLAAAHPATVAAARERLVFGGVVSPSTAAVLLTHLRSQVAMLALAAEIAWPTQMPTWKANALAEIALDGIDAFRRLVIKGPSWIDVDGEIADHRRLRDRDQPASSERGGATIVEAVELDLRTARCPRCGDGIFASGRRQPFVLLEGRILCRRHGAEAHADYARRLAEYDRWRAERVIAFRAFADHSEN